MTVLKNTFGFTFANCEGVLEDIIHPYYFNDHDRPIGQIRHSLNVNKSEFKTRKTQTKVYKT